MDFLPSDFLGSFSAKSRRPVFSSSAGESGVAWERLKIGCGTPPILTRHGWLVVYHGVSEIGQPSNGVHHLCYAAGVMVLSKENPQVIRYRSTETLLTPTLPQER